jgi:Zn-finger nucleic acid-binding protein
VKCPACPTISLVMTERSGIEIDYCPDCRGVWLDRGELDKIIERATPTTPASQPAPPAGPYPPDTSVPAGRPARRDHDDDDDFDDFDDFDDDDDPRRYRGENTRDGRPVGKRRKKGLLGDLFDF